MVDIEVLKGLRDELLNDDGHEEVKFVRSVLLRLIECIIPDDTKADKKAKG